jgi:sigma-E factor negative regulatory protein RseC
MLETRAIVIKVEGREALVEAVHGGGCGACGGGKGCGSGKLAEAFCVRPRQFRARNDVQARVGEEVEITVTDGALLRSALTLYGLPLMSLFAGALLGARWQGGDGGAAFGALAGLVAGFALAAAIAARQRRLKAAALPSISRRAGAGQQQFS